MKKMAINLLLAGLVLSTANAASIKVQDDNGVSVHYIPDSAKNIKKESLKVIPHIVEKDDIISVMNDKGIPISMRCDKNVDAKFKENFNRIFEMQTGGQRSIDKIVILRPVPKTNIKLVVYILNGVIIPAFATEDGTAMFQYSPIVTGHGINRYNYAYIDSIIAQVRQIGKALGGKSRYVKMALNLKDNPYKYRIKKGDEKKAQVREYYFADPMCPICKEHLEKLRKEKNTDTTILLVPALREGGIESIMRSAFIVQELSEKHITDPNEILNTMLSYFKGGGSYATGAFPQKKYINAVRDTMKAYLPVTQNEIPFKVSYETIEKMQKNLAFTKPEQSLKKLDIKQ